MYERKIFTTKDGRFKQESFLDEAKVFYTDLINQMVLDDKDRLSIFDKNGPYLATKKVGKNNPKAEEIKADNEIRMEWNRAVDRAIVSGVSDAELVELKKTEITDRVKESVEQNGSKPELFGDIVRAGIALLERLIAKVMQKVMDAVEKVVGKAVDAIKESQKETESHIHAKDEPLNQPERKKIPLPVNPHRKEVATERPPQPKPSVLVGKYTRLQEIDSKLKDQNQAIWGREKKLDLLKEELSECTGIFKGSRRKELQQEINEIDIQISNMKKRLSSIVNEYKFDSVQAFYKEFKAAKREYLDYKAACAEWEKTYGEKVTNPKSIRERLRQKEQMVKERESGRVNQTRQKDKGAR